MVFPKKELIVSVITDSYQFIDLNRIIWFHLARFRAPGTPEGNKASL